ncbi:VWA domain-containing protein [Rhodococcus erythropolis]|uniref:vWA domain-containing protein n=1 Tax=Rhodococcus erythropolis TaxID=1833 RepID=UPI00038E6570|nr:VWA domain-containing protein [Rhodococcus erythropolis]EQM33267.1 hypothetical protein N601_13440 [Rhodococcus erythropolis DN1]MDJ0406733.1 VWA domain-containing protein [Rhodococcus erythropolis]
MRLRVAICIAATAIIAVGCSTQGSGGPKEAGGTQEVGGPQQASVTADPVSEASATAPSIIVLDASGSMKQDDAPGPRIDAAKNAIHTLVSGLPDDTALGLIAYGTATGSSDAEKDEGCRDIKTVVPLGPLDRNAFAAGIDGLSASGYTPIMAALQQAAAALPTDGERTIILVSDGEDTCSTEPPCESTEAIPHDPDLTIHTIGFKLDAAASGQLKCIADATGGMAIDAANAAQLTARLAVASNPESARERLSTSGFRNLRIGMTVEDARKAAGDLASVSKTGTVVVEWQDCELTFTDGVLVEIAPRTGAVTLDGLAVGQKMQRAAELYGPFTATTNSDGESVAVFPADSEAGTGYRITFTPEGKKADEGTITRIVLCRCLPATAGSSAGGTPTEIVNLVAVDGSGKPKSGWSVKTPAMKISECYGASQSAVTPGVITCGSTADGADACWVGPEPDSILCLQFPWGTELITARGVDGVEAYPPPADPTPFGLELENGLLCRVRHGGSWPSAESDPRLAGAYSCRGQGTDTPIVWAESTYPIDRSEDRWTVLVGPSKGPLETVAVTKAIFLAAE